MVIIPGQFLVGVTSAPFSRLLRRVTWSSNRERTILLPCVTWALLSPWEETSPGDVLGDGPDHLVS